MKVVIQRVNNAELSVEGKLISNINKGIVVYLGIGKGDSINEVKWLANKTAKLRIFNDENNKMNLSALDLDLDIMVVSQFTLYGNLSSGYRPSFSNAESPEKAKELYECFYDELKNLGLKNVVTGVFGADMLIKQENSGPVTIILDTKELIKKL